MTTDQQGTLAASQGLMARAAPGGRAFLVLLALLAPGTSATLIALDARQAGVVDDTLLTAGGVFAACAVAVGVMAVRRLRALAAVADAVRCAAVHQAAGVELRVDPGLGAVAKAWNSLVERDMVSPDAGPLAAVNPRSLSDLGLLDALPDGLFLLDRGRRLLAVNASGRVLLGVEPDEDVPLDRLQEFIGPDAAASLERAISGSLPRRVEHERTVIDGRSQALKIGVAPVPGSPPMVLITADDITRQRAAEASRGEFLAQATHELRAPLTNIRLYVDSAIEEGEEEPELRAEALNVIASETQRLERIVSDLLNISELESGSRTTHRGDVRIEQMLEDTRRAFERAAEEKQITLSFEVAPQLPVLKGDRDHVAMLIQNLVSNAIKYTPEGGSVTVRAQTDQGQFLLDVVDTGIGIAPEEANLVFEKFYRAKDDRIAGIKGSGLGLAFAKEVARQHGGDLTIDTELNRGSTFTLRLPAGRAA
ncbi:MAG: sensor histidine kinase [Phycisphaerales bacterium]